MVGTFAIGLWVSSSVFEHTPHVEDEGAYLFQAKTLAGGHLTADSPPVDDAFFFTPFLIDDGQQWYGKYTPGYPAVLAVGAAAGAPWVVNPLAAALAVGLTVLLGTRVYGRRTGLLAGALLALSPMALLHSGTFFSHQVALCWTLGALLAAERAWRTGSNRAGTMVGVCLAALALTRPLTALAVAAPLACAAAVHVRPHRRQVTLAALGAPLMAVGLLMLYNLHTTGSATRFGYEVYWPFDRVGFGPGFGPGDLGHTLASGWLNTKVNLRQLRTWLFGWPGGLDLLPVIVAAVVAAGLLAVRARHRMVATADVVAADVVAADDGAALVDVAVAADDDVDLPANSAAPDDGSVVRLDPVGFDLLLLGVAVAPIVAHVAYWTSGSVHGPRYYFEGLAAMALLAARAAHHVATGLSRLGLRVRVAQWGMAGAFIGLSAVGLFTTTADRFDDARGFYGVSTDGLRALEAMHLHDALVFVPIEHWTDFEPYSAANSPFLDTDVVYAVHFGAKDERLIDAMPDRTPYVWANGVLTPWAESVDP